MLQTHPFFFPSGPWEHKRPFYLHPLTTRVRVGWADIFSAWRRGLRLALGLSCGCEASSLTSGFCAASNRLWEERIDVSQPKLFIVHNGACHRHLPWRNPSPWMCKRGDWGDGMLTRCCRLCRNSCRWIYNWQGPKCGPAVEITVDLFSKFHWYRRRQLEENEEMNTGVQDTRCPTFIKGEN